MWIETHSHLNFKAFEADWREAVERAVATGVKKIIVVGADVDSSRRAVELAQEHPALWAAVGIHPHHSQQIANGQWQIEAIKQLASQPKVVAIGEIGLDYHVYKNSKYGEQDIDKEAQRQLFEAQLAVAADLDKPVIFHSRECGEEVLESVKVSKHKSVIKGVFHCFGGSKKYLKKILAAGFYVGFTGQVTYVPDRVDVAREVPLDRLLLETDCPYMPPFRQPQRSEPADVTIIGQFLAQAMGLPIQKLERATTRNALRLFKC